MSKLKMLKPAVYLWATLMSALVGFAVVYVTMQLVGNGNLLPSGSTGAAVTPSPAKASPAISTGRRAAGGIAGALEGLNRGQMAAFIIRKSPKDIADFSFQTEDGTKKTLKDWQGKMVLLNLWATWCAPCRQEMPQLDRLKAELGGDKFDLITISIDRGGLNKPRKFFDQIGIKNLKLYGALSRSLATTLKAIGMPTTILIDTDGKEVGRLIGPAEWASKDAKALLMAAIDAAG